MASLECVYDGIEDTGKRVLELILSTEESADKGGGA